MSPFAHDYDINTERQLIERARVGSAEAATRLIGMHQRFIYNIALKFVGDRDNAKDFTQEVLIKMLTKLAQFQFKSSFRTWLYRIALNQFINEKKLRTQTEVKSLDEFGDFLDNYYSDETMTVEEQEQYSDEIVFVRNKCLASMLLCLDRQQRMVYILGSIFNLKGPVAANLLGISPINFRKQLSRAKEDLFQFMQNKCGLVNPDNPCRCFKKTKGFIRDGLVDPNTIQFSPRAIEAISDIVPKKTKDLDTLVNGKYLRLFMDMPYEKIEQEDMLVRSLLGDPEVKALFSLN